MKKILLCMLTFLFLGVIVNAQIKVVEDDYFETLSATKNFYEKDLVFDSLFPQVNYKEEFKDLWAWTDCGIYHEKPYNYGFLGDTFYIASDIPLDISEYGSLSFVLKQTNDTVSCLGIVPKGFYVVSGYVFCNGGYLRGKYTRNSVLLPRYHGGGSRDRITDQTRIKEVKECLLINEQDLKEKGISECLQYDYLILKSTNEPKYEFYCRGLNNRILDGSWAGSDKSFRFLNVEFYNELKKHFLGKEVSIIMNGGFNHQDFGFPQGFIKYTIKDDELIYDHKFIKYGDIFSDALSKDKLKVLDSVFVVKDIVLKGSDLYCILEGEKTGLFPLFR